MRKRLGNYIHEDRLGAYSSRSLWLLSLDSLRMNMVANEAFIRRIIKRSAYFPIRVYLQERIYHAKTSQE